MQITHKFSKSELDEWIYQNHHAKEVSFPTKEKLHEYLEQLREDIQVLIDKLIK